VAFISREERPVGDAAIVVMYSLFVNASVSPVARTKQNKMSP